MQAEQATSTENAGEWLDSVAMDALMNAASGDTQQWTADTAHSDADSGTQARQPCGVYATMKSTAYLVVIGRRPFRAIRTTHARAGERTTRSSATTEQPPHSTSQQ